MGAISKPFAKITDAFGLTNTDELAQQQKLAEEQRNQIQAQAALDNDQSGENLNQVDSGGAASASATAVTSEQKARRKGAASTALGI